VTALATPGVEPFFLREVIRLAAATSGMRAAAIRVEPVVKVVHARLGAGEREADVLRAIEAGDRELTAALHAAITVRETYFFRQPEQFDLVARLDLPAGHPVRAWSAACATGEEAYSLAAALRGAGRSARDVRVLGTDLVEDNLATARAGVYGARSVRVSGPLLFPIFERTAPSRDGSSFVVDPGLRQMTSFAAHNLLDPPPDGEFDVIFCRNALLYFEPEAAKVACEHLARALAPQGLLVFGPLDLPVTPRGLTSVGAAGAQVFTHRESLSRIRIQVDSGRHPSTAPLVEVAAASRASEPPPAPRTAPGPISLHMGVLECLERGDLGGARTGLDVLHDTAPDYLPGIMERALWHRRRGEHARCRALVREVWDRAHRLEPATIVEGPEPLPAGFYVTSARTLLDGRGT
jgi:chemotaxis protein methyltransferase CheR